MTLDVAGHHGGGEYENHTDSLRHTLTHPLYQTHIFRYFQYTRLAGIQDTNTRFKGDKRKHDTRAHQFEVESVKTS